MRRALFLIVTLVGLGAVNTPAYSIGCLSGGAAGALAGHMAGHGVLGAVGGCIAGHSWNKHQMRKQDLENRSAYETRRQSYDPNYRSPYTN